MFGKKKEDVREHSQEREWLLSLGNGNIFEGVQNLIEEAKDRRTSRRERGRRRSGRY